MLAQVLGVLVVRFDQTQIDAEEMRTVRTNLSLRNTGTYKKKGTHDNIVKKKRAANVPRHKHHAGSRQI